MARLLTLLYAYHRRDLSLEVYKQVIMVRQRLGGPTRLLIYPLHEVVRVRSTGGWLILDVDGEVVRYTLGPLVTEAAAVIQTCL